MKKIKYLLIISIFISICIINSSCINGQNLEKKINNTIFQEVRKVAVVKMAESEYLYSLFSNDEIDIMKKEFQNISNIKKIKLNPLKRFENYHLLYLFLNGSNKSVTILYSMNLKLIMLKESDIYPDRTRNFHEITIYQFEIPEKVHSILNRHEQKLPNNGEFIKSWPVND